MLALIFGSSVYLAFDDQASACFESFLKSPASPVMTRTLTAVWMAGFTLTLLYSVFRFIQGARLAKSWKPVIAESLHGLSGISTLFKMDLPEVKSVKTKESPFVFGLLKPVLVLPEDFLESARPETLRSVISHELAHIESSDNIYNLISLFIRQLFFFHPLVYLSSRLYADVQEKAADARAVKILKISKSEFANSIIDMLEFGRNKSALSYQSASAFGFYSLKSRLEFLAESRDENSFRGLFYVLTALSVSLTWSVVEAKSSLIGESANGAQINMCVQVQHEQTLEKIFSVKAQAPVRCE
jgi:beta-lactamase regulating signal transducer with metallopeptidase domain